MFQVLHISIFITEEEILSFFTDCNAFMTTGKQYVNYRKEIFLQLWQTQETHILFWQTAKEFMGLKLVGS
jgi:ureidoglycolate hydrolase